VPNYAIFAKFYVFAQKPLGRHEGVAKRDISFNSVSGFCLELLGGGDEGLTCSFLRLLNMV